VLPNTPLYEVKWQAQQALNCRLDFLIRQSGCRLREASTLEELGLEDGETVSAATLRRPLPANRLAHAFALVRRDGSLVVWGNQSLGGDCLEVQEQLKEVEDVIFSHGAAAARLANGRVVTWGDQRYGADSSTAQAELHDVRDIRAAYDTFAALRSDGRVVMWSHRGSACLDHPRGFIVAAAVAEAVQRQPESSHQEEECGSWHQQGMPLPRFSKRAEKWSLGAMSSTAAMLVLQPRILSTFARSRPRVPPSLLFVRMELSSRGAKQLQAVIPGL
ncbi:unnamed protein product, partial [Symbiodinium sp. CCMP2456]